MKGVVERTRWLRRRWRRIGILRCYYSRSKADGEEGEGEESGNPRFISQSVTPGLLLLLLQGLPDPSVFAACRQFNGAEEERATDSPIRLRDQL